MTSLQSTITQSQIDAAKALVANAQVAYAGCSRQECREKLIHCIETEKDKLSHPKFKSLSNDSVSTKLLIVHGILAATIEDAKSKIKWSNIFFERYSPI